MNERIRKLAEQAGLEYNFDPMLWLKYEKFAELIVQECGIVIQDFVDHRIPASEYRNRLKDHFKEFGVEE